MEQNPTPTNQQLSAQPQPPPSTPQTVPPPPPRKSSLLTTLLLLTTLVAVGIAGFLAYQNVKLKQEPVDTAIPLVTPTMGTPTPAAIDTSGWKSYTNATHHIFFRYPKTWTLSEEKGQTERGVTYNTQVIMMKGDAKITMYFNIIGIGGMPQEYEGTPFVLDGNNLYQFRKTLSSTNTKLVGISNSLKTLGLFMLDNITYQITLEYPAGFGQTEETALVDEFNRILATFKFTTDTVTPAAGWQSYTHTKFADRPDWKIPWSGFTLFYPADWQIKTTRNDEAPGLNVRITKNNGDYFEIIQGAGGYQRCVFPEETDYLTFEGMGTKYTDYAAINKSTLINWRLADNPDRNPDSLWTHTLCEQNSSNHNTTNFFDNTIIGFTKIKVTTPQSLQELKDILTRIKIEN